MYFDKPGKVNTQQTLELACQRGRELGLNEVVLAHFFDLRIREIICKPRDF